jgi:bifunctional DNA-binding transcriptional regulator/antitoxin component of YhaV-PrlF toxin-antitoxin module
MAADAARAFQDDNDRDQRVPATPPPRWVRRVTQNGNSLTVVIPTVVQKTLNLFKGSDVEVILDREWGGVFIRPLRPVGLRPVPPCAADEPPPDHG